MSRDWYSITGHDPETDTYEHIRSVTSLEEAEMAVESIIKAQANGTQYGRRRYYDRFTVADSCGRILKSWKGN